LGTGHTVVCGAGAVYTAALFANSFLQKSWQRQSRADVARVAVAFVRKRG
jgi:hypothetical protein